MGFQVTGVCVIIPAYNAEGMVARAVRSALAQPEAAEVIVVDDGSKDATAEAARPCDDGSGRLKVLSRPGGGGPAGARNLALSVSRAEWVCPLDADDYLQPGRLGRLLAQAEGCDVIADDLLRSTDSRPDGPYSTLISHRMRLPRTVSFAEFLEDNITRPGRERCEMGWLKPLIRREFLDSHGLRYDETLRLGEDCILYANLLANGAHFRVVEACGYIALDRDHSLSAGHGSRELSNLLAAARALAAQPRLSRADRAAARAYEAHIGQKAKLHEVLDVKRERGWSAAMMSLAREPQFAPYVLRRYAADKLAKPARQEPADVA